MTVSDVKLYMRIDYDDDDNLITSLVSSAKSIIQDKTGKTYDEADELWNLAIKQLVSHWYDNRGTQNSTNLYDIDYSTDEIIKHIALCSRYT